MHRNEIFRIVDASSIEEDEYTFYVGVIAEDPAETYDEGDIIPHVNSKDEITELTVQFETLVGGNPAEIEEELNERSERILDSYGSEPVSNFGYELIKEPLTKQPDGTFTKVVALTPISPYLEG